VVYFTTEEFFYKCKLLKENENMRPSKAVLVRNYFAFASKYKSLSEKQFSILQDIAIQNGYDLSDSVISSGAKNEMV